ncbi:hypothetical protein GYMLUDRAFT_32423 [Collybiopsis luxurians FD-317 M1]|nr:hypothetical protein GYMLUDRAFT_32423 [Collybiopsis luxurians FD-317 M1]
MAERVSSTSSRHRSQPSTSRTNTSTRSRSTQRGYVPSVVYPPQPISGPRPMPRVDSNGQAVRRSYYATNPDPPTEDEDFVEANAQILNRNLQPGPSAMPEQELRRKGGKRKFIGGFVKSLRRIPRTMFRSAPADPTGPSSEAPRQPVPPFPVPPHPGIPEYMLTPPTPVAPPQQTSYVDEARVAFPRPDIEPSDIFPPATSPHPTRIEIDEQELNPNRDADNQPLSRHTSHHRNPSSTSYAYPNSYHDRERPENPTTSIEAHPQPSPDYRRMSRHTGDESIHPNPTSYSGTPSFSTELDRSPFRVFKVVQTLINMPWVSHDRVTVDYSPGMAGVIRADALPEGDQSIKRGSLKERLENTRWSILDQGWKPWKRTSVFLTLDGRVVSPQEGPRALARGDARKGKMYVPVDKPQTSWYSGGYLNKVSRNKRRSTTSSRDLDLMSSGSDPVQRSSVGTTPRPSTRRRVSRSTVNTSPSPTSPSSNPMRRMPRSRVESRRFSHTPRRHSRRLYYSTDEYVFLDPGSTPVSSPILARKSRTNNPKPRPSPRDRARRERHGDVGRQHSREVPRVRSPAMPPPPASPYPLSPLVFFSPNHMDSATASPGGVEAHPQTGMSGSAVPAVFGVTPVPMYMSILPGIPPPPGSASGIGESSPPGLAGRGAGGGYGTGYGYNIQGYSGGAGGAYAYGHTYPYPYPQSPPQVQRHDDDKHRPPQTSG